MVGIRLTGMQPGPDRFRASLVFEQWPSVAAQAAWDATHARILIKLLTTAEGPSPQARELARRLAWDNASTDGSPVPTTMASVRYRYLISEEIAAHASHLCEHLEEPAHFFTVIPDYGEADRPDDLDARSIKERFRNDLNDRGAIGSDGILFAVLEAEYQVRTGRWRFHWHGVASGGKLLAINRLRALRAYHSPRRRPGEPKASVPYRIKVSQRPLYDLPKPLTYCIKPWSARWENEAGKRGPRLRMPLHAIPATLFWQDRWSISDTTLLMGLRVRSAGLFPLGSTRMKGGDP